MAAPLTRRTTTPLTRRSMMHGLAAVTAAAALSPAVTARAASGLDVAARERSSGARIGVVGINLDGPQRIGHREHERFAVCSTFKTYAAAAVLAQADRGQALLTAPVAIVAADVVANSPVTAPAVGGTLTLAQLCAAALQRSDNTAGNLLLRQLGGPPAVTAFARSLGDDTFRLDRVETALNSAVPGDDRDTGTPAGLAAGYRALLAGDALAGDSRRQLTEWMRANQTSSLRPGLPAGWVSVDKTGSGDYGSTNDVGILEGPAGQRLLVAVMARSAADDPAAPGYREVIGALAGPLVATLAG